jgi:hypothetical protein
MLVMPIRSRVSLVKAEIATGCACCQGQDPGDCDAKLHSVTHAHSCTPIPMSEIFTVVKVRQGGLCVNGFWVKRSRLLRD